MMKFKLFQNMSEQECQKILSLFKKKHFNKKEYIQFPGMGQDFIYLVGSGRVKVSYLSPEGKEIIVTILYPGDIYSLHSEANAAVLEPADIWYMGLNDFRSIIVEHPLLAVNLIRILGTILKNTNDALLNLAFKEVNSRLASLLIKLAKESGVPSPEGIIVELGLTHEDIANLISSTRQTVTTILNRFVKQGLIQVDKKTIIIKNLQELAQLSV